MKLKTKFYGLFLGLAVTIACQAPAFASSTYGSSSAAIDWTTLQVSIESTSQSQALQISWYNGSDYGADGIHVQGSSSEAAALNSWHSGWTDLSTGQDYMHNQTIGYGSSSANVPGLAPYNAFAETSSNQLFSSAAVTAADDTAYSAASDAARWGQFYVTSGEGTVTISFDYTLSAEVQGQTGRAYGGSEAWANLRHISATGIEETNGIMLDILSLVSVNTSTDTKSGTLSVSYAFSEGTQGFFEAGTRSEAAAYNTQAVPLPGSFLFLGAGLLSFAATGREKHKVL